MKIQINSTTALITNQKSSINSRVELNTNLSKRAKIDVQANIEGSTKGTAKTELKTTVDCYKNSPSESHLPLDSKFQNRYHGTKSELDEIAKNWVELVLKQLMEKNS